MWGVPSQNSHDSRGGYRLGCGVQANALLWSKVWGHIWNYCSTRSLCHFMRRPQSIPWQLHLAIDNMSRHNATSNTCRMATHLILLLDEGGIHACNCKSKTTKSTQKPPPLLPPLWCIAFLLGNQIPNGQLLHVCPNYVRLVTRGGGVKLQAEVFTCWGNQQQAEHPM